MTNPSGAIAGGATAVPRRIESLTHVQDGLKVLCRICPAMRDMYAFAGDPPLRRNADGFVGLTRIIVGQQVSVASANAIWSRFSAVAQPISARVVGALSDEDFRAGGLSRPKIKTLRAISAAVEAGLDLQSLADMDEADARTKLTAVSGIGPWTADIYLMFCLGRVDAFASGDLALQEAVRMIFELEQRPTATELDAIAERWKPWRAVAARMLWHYYAAKKAPKSGQPV
jgi:DNA-3-methyladenine glycosylase II